MLLAIFLGLIGFWQVGMFIALILLIFGGKHFSSLIKGSSGHQKKYKEAKQQNEENKP